MDSGGVPGFWQGLLVIEFVASMLLSVSILMGNYRALLRLGTEANRHRRRPSPLCRFVRQPQHQGQEPRVPCVIIPDDLMPLMRTTKSTRVVWPTTHNSHDEHLDEMPT